MNKKQQQQNSNVLRRLFTLNLRENTVYELLKTKHSNFNEKQHQNMSTSIDKSHSSIEMWNKEIYHKCFVISSNFYFFITNTTKD